jgi:hypothetical protein
VQDCQEYFVSPSLQAELRRSIDIMLRTTLTGQGQGSRTVSE